MIKAKRRLQVSFFLKSAFAFVLSMIPLQAMSALSSMTPDLPATSWSIYFEESSAVDSIQWDPAPREVKKEGTGPGAGYSTFLSGTLKYRKKVSLLVNFEPIAIGPEGKFNFKFLLPLHDFSSNVTVVDKRGNVQTTKILVKFVAPIAPSKLAPVPSPKPQIVYVVKLVPQPAQAVLTGNRQYTSSVGLSLSSIQYEQTSLSPMRDFSLTGKVGVTHQVFLSPWNYSGNIFFTGLPFANTSPQKVNLTFFGFNARVGYELPWPKKPWRLNFMSGFYFTSANAKANPSLDSNLGYSVSGIQISPTLSRTFLRGDLILGYLKIAPLSNGFAIGFTSYEYAGGLQYLFVPRVDGSGFSVSGDYSKLKLNLDALSANTTSISLGFNYHL